MHFIGHYKQCIKISYKALLTNKGRSFLTMLGIIIGVGAVIIIMAVGAGAQNLILSEIKSFGTNLVGVLPGGSDKDGPPASLIGIIITSLTYDDMVALSDKKNVPDITDIVSYYKGVASVSWGANSYDTNISGTTVGYQQVESHQVKTGRFFTKDEELNLSKVAVLGSTVKEELFGDSEAIGQRIKFKKISFEVIGVMKEKGTVAMQNYDDQILIPIKTMQKLIAGVNHISFLRAKVNYPENINTVIEDIKNTLRERHDIIKIDGSQDDFTVRSGAQALEVITTVTDALKYFLVAIAAISLLVGGIGIMNIMLVSVTERTREIGLRKAIGANTLDIMSQFLIEAMSVTILGGLIGIIFGGFISFLIFIIAKLLGYDWVLSISIWSILLAVGVCSVVGLIFGLYPAKKASTLDPIEALRYE